MRNAMSRKTKRLQYPKFEVTVTTARHRVISGGTVFAFVDDAPFWFCLKPKIGPKISVRLSFEQDDSGRTHVSWETSRSGIISVKFHNVTAYAVYGSVSTPYPICIARHQGMAIYLSLKASKIADDTPWQIDYCFFIGKELQG